MGRKIGTRSVRIRRGVIQPPIQCTYEHDQTVDAEGRLEALFEFLLREGGDDHGGQSREQEKGQES